MRRGNLLLVLFFSLIPRLWAYQWAASGGEVSSSFGEVKGNMVQKNISITGNSSMVVQASLSGEVIFEQDEMQATMASKKGKTVVLRHSEEMRTIYSNLNEWLYEDYSVDSLQSIATPAIAAFGAREFTLTFYDNKKRQFVNPMLFVISNSSIRLSSINWVFIRDASGSVRPIVNDAVVASGRIEVVALPVEYSRFGSYALQPYSTSLEFMGETVKKVQLDAISSNAGVGMLVGASMISTNDLYSSEGYLRLGHINLIAGQVYVTIRVADINGREVQRMIRLIVN